MTKEEFLTKHEIFSKRYDKLKKLYFEIHKFNGEGCNSFFTGFLLSKNCKKINKCYNDTLYYFQK